MVIKEIEIAGKIYKADHWLEVLPDYMHKYLDGTRMLYLESFRVGLGGMEPLRKLFSYPNQSEIHEAWQQIENLHANKSESMFSMGALLAQFGQTVIWGARSPNALQRLPVNEYNKLVARGKKAVRILKEVSQELEIDERLDSTLFSFFVDGKIPRGYPESDFNDVEKSIAAEIKRRGDSYIRFLKTNRDSENEGINEIFSGDLRSHIVNQAGWIGDSDIKFSTFLDGWEEYNLSEREDETYGRPGRGSLRHKLLAYDLCFFFERNLGDPLFETAALFTNAALDDSEFVATGDYVRKLYTRGNSKRGHNEEK